MLDHPPIFVIVKYQSTSSNFASSWVFVYIYIYIYMYIYHNYIVTYIYISPFISQPFPLIKSNSFILSGLSGDPQNETPMVSQRAPHLATMNSGFLLRLLGTTSPNLLRKTWEHYWTKLWDIYIIYIYEHMNMCENHLYMEVFMRTSLNYGYDIFQRTSL